MLQVAGLRPINRLHRENELARAVSIAQACNETIALLDRVLSTATPKIELICLPEDCLMMMQANHSEDSSGPVCTALSQLSEKHRVTIAAGIVLREGDRQFNATVIFNPAGHLVGSYYKTHLTKLEREKYGIFPGDSLPVFDLPFGKLGVITCADILFPEVARCLALSGANLAVFPHQMAEPDDEFFRTMICARAQDNCLPIVSSTFADEPGRAWFPNWIVGAEGRIVAAGDLGEGATCAAVRIDRNVPLVDYIEPGKIQLWDIIQRYRRPELYQQVTKP